MPNSPVGPEIQKLIDLMAKLPGFGPRSARRAVLHLLRKPDQLLGPLGDAIRDAADNVSACETCGNLDSRQPCSICAAPGRDDSTICVVAGVADLWALERANAFRGRYHVLGGVLSALDGISPRELNIPSLLTRAQKEETREIILALNATVDGQTTAHYLSDRLVQFDVRVSRLAHGVPVGGELDHLDDGTLLAALSSRHDL